jgi:glycerol transport system permease protein
MAQPNQSGYAGKRPGLLALPAAMVGVAAAAVALAVTMVLALYDIRDPFTRTFVGGEWFAVVISDPALHTAVLNQLVFTSLVLVIEVPLGVALAFALPRHGAGATLWIVLLALPLATPWGVIGMMGKVVAHPDVGFLGDFMAQGGALEAWVLVTLVDAWHWTPLVALLCHAGLRAIPGETYDAMRIDGASSRTILRHVEIPAILLPLAIAAIFRVADSLATYAAPVVMFSEGPAEAPVFLTQFVAESALDRFDLGAASAVSALYVLAVLPLALVAYGVIAGRRQGGRSCQGGRS